MRRARIVSLTLTGLAVVAGECGCRTDTARRDPVAVAEFNAVEFLKREVPAWSRGNGCFSCHNNGDAARALYAAIRRGYRIPSQVLADTTDWVAQPGGWDHNKGDPGFSDKRLANIQFASSLLAASEAGRVKDRGALREAARKVTADQDADGAWHIEPGNAVGSPATYGTILATYVALTTLRQDAETPGTRDAIRKAELWLSLAKANSVLAAATLLLAAADDAKGSARPGPLPTQASASSDGERSVGREAMKAVTNLNSAFPVEECLNLIRRAQTSDGGWGPYADSPPEPFDTALVLLALVEVRAADKAGRDLDVLIQRGRGFLVAQQNPDGSWPATTRPPGGNSYAQRLSTTGWVTLALLATRR